MHDDTASLAGQTPRCYSSLRKTRRLLVASKPDCFEPLRRQLREAGSILCNDASAFDVTALWRAFCLISSVASAGNLGKHCGCGTSSRERVDSLPTTSSGYSCRGMGSRGES